MDDDDNVDVDVFEKQEKKEKKVKKIKIEKKPRKRRSKPTLMRTTLNNIIDKEKILKDKTEAEKANYNNQKINFEIHEQASRDKETKLITINKIIRECIKIASETHDSIKSDMFSSFIPSINSLTEKLQSYLFVLENKQKFDASSDKIEDKLQQLINTIIDYNKNISQHRHHHHNDNNNNNNNNDINQINNYLEYNGRLDKISRKFNESCLQARGLYNLFFVNNTPNHFNPELKNHNLWPSLLDISSMWNFAPSFQIITFTKFCSHSTFSSSSVVINRDETLHKDEVEFIQDLQSPPPYQKTTLSSSHATNINLSNEKLNRLSEIKDRCIIDINKILITLNKIKTNVQNLLITFEHIYNEIFLKFVFEITIIKRFSVY
jgi:hypothetical protein